MKFKAEQIAKILEGEFVGNPNAEVLQGSTSFTYSDYSKSYVHFRNLPKIVTELEELKKTINKNI